MINPPSNGRCDLAARLARKYITLGFICFFASGPLGHAMADEPLSTLPQATLIAWLHSFVVACVNQMGGSNYGKLYCPCAAAIIADRFTMDEVTDGKIMASPTSIDDAHPGTGNLMKVCAMAAKPSD